MSRNEFGRILFWSLMSFAWITFFADNMAGMLISILAFFILIYYGLFKKKKLIEVSLFLLFLIPEYPRDILFLYDSLSSNEIFYNTVNTVKIGPLTLFYWAIITLPVAIVVFNKFKLSRASGIAVSAVVLLLAWLVFITLINDQPFDLSIAITNVKIYIVLICVFLILSNWKEQELKAQLQSFLIFLPVIIGLRVILFIAYDFTLGTPSWDYFTQPLISVITFILFLQTKDKTIFERSMVYRILFYISLFSLSRALIGIVIITLFFSFLLSKKIKLKFKVMMEIIPFFTVLCFAVLVTNPNLYNFLLWKVSDLNVFQENKEMSGSGKVRQYEVINILDGNESSEMKVLLGYGLSGSFNFDKYPLPILEALDSKSFSEKERLGNRYFFPHSFIAANLLRGGLLLLLLYLFVHFALFVYFFKSNEYYLSVLSIFLIYNSYVRVEYALLLSILITLALLKNQVSTIQNNSDKATHS